MKIFIVIPAYNEEKTIGQTLLSLTSLYSHIVVVSDGSTDDTILAVQQIPEVKIIKHPINRGQGAALQTGNEYALLHGADIIVHFDADGQHDVNDIERLIEPIILGTADIVLGSRFLGVSNVSYLRKIFLKAAIIFQWFLTGIKLTDAHNGLRAMSAKTARLIHITQDKMAHNTEIIAEIARYGIRFKEVPVKLHYSKDLQARAHYEGTIKRTFSVLKEIFKGRLIS